MTQECYNYVFKCTLQASEPVSELAAQSLHLLQYKYNSVERWEDYGWPHLCNCKYAMRIMSAVLGQSANLAVGDTVYTKECVYLRVWILKYHQGSAT